MDGGKGNAESMVLKGKARQWTGVEGAGKATIGESQHPLHHTIEAYREEKEMKSIFRERAREGERLGCAETICRCGNGESCGGPPLEKGKGKKLEMGTTSILQGETEWGPNSILPGTVFQLVERQEPRRVGSDPYKLGGLGAAKYKKI